MVRRKDLEDMARRIQELEKAVGFYADPSNWTVKDKGFIFIPNLLNDDGGPNVARKVLNLAPVNQQRLEELKEKAIAAADQKAKTISGQWQKP
jgi:NOL1/NOP2/fmu family ribosome biogenesis protein